MIMIIIITTTITSRLNEDHWLGLWSLNQNIRQTEWWHVQLPVFPPLVMKSRKWVVCGESAEPVWTFGHVFVLFCGLPHRAAVCLFPAGLEVSPHDDLSSLLDLHPSVLVRSLLAEFRSLSFVVFRLFLCKHKVTHFILQRIFLIQWFKVLYFHSIHKITKLSPLIKDQSILLVYYIYILVY